MLITYNTFLDLWGENPYIITKEIKAERFEKIEF